VFVYGDARHGKWLGTLGRLGNQINLIQLQAAQRGEDPEEALAGALIDLIQKDPDLLRVPATVIGFRLQNVEPAQAQLDRLETHLKQAIAAKAPQLEGRLTRQTIGEGNYLSLNLDGSLVPWDKVLEDAEFEPEAQEKLVQQLRQTKLAINLGLRADYLILALGEDDAALQSLGQGDLLVDHPKLQPLTKYFDRPVTSLAYASEEFLQQVAGVEERLNQMRDMFKAALPMAPIGEDIKEDLARDADVFFQQAIALQPRIGATAAIGYEVPAGFESVAYDWTEHRNYDATRPLTILSHVGGDPIGFFAWRGKPAVEEAQFMSAWSAKLGQYIERIGKPYLNEDQSGLYDKLKERLLPLMARLKTANQQQLQPALADGQAAIVLDARLTNKQWHAAMPAADQPLPLPELTIVRGLSDAAKLRAGGQEYFDVAQSVITVLSETFPDNVPAQLLPRPQTRESAAGSLYYYSIPPFLGLDAAIAPNIGVGSDVIAISLIPQATERVLASTQVQRFGPLEEAADKPLAFAWQFSLDRFVEAIRPWAAYGLQLAEQEGAADAEVAAQVDTILDVLQCFQNAGGIGYVEGDATVGHARLEFQDLP
jgi:hypothetical protein